MIRYLNWLITLLISIFEVSFTDNIIVCVVLLKKRVVGGVPFDGAYAYRMESRAKQRSSLFSNTL